MPVDMNVAHLYVGVLLLNGPAKTQTGGVLDIVVTPETDREAAALGDFVHTVGDAVRGLEHVGGVHRPVANVDQRSRVGEQAPSAIHVGKPLVPGNRMFFRESQRGLADAPGALPCEPAPLYGAPLTTTIPGSTSSRPARGSPMNVESVVNSDGELCLIATSTSL